MTLKQEFLQALRAGENDQLLLEVVYRHQAAGMSPRESYFALQEIWLECGYDHSEQGGPVRDALEYTMERVWFQGAAAPSLPQRRGNA